MRRSTFFAIVMFLCIAVPLAFGQARPSSGDMVVSTALVAEHAKDAGLVVLHVGVDRTVYDAGHIPGARFLSWDKITVVRNGVPNQLPAAATLQASLQQLGVGDHSRVVMYGDSPLFPAYAFFVLDYLGHADHAVLDGGLERWKAEQRPMSKVAPTFKSATLNIKPRPELVVDLAAVRKLLDENKTTFIDGRPPEQYSGANPGDGVQRGGHIPGAHNVFWMRTLVSKQDPVLKPIAEIRALYEAAGAKRGEPVVVYCRTGPIATHQYFTMKLAGFQPVLYNGSFMEWSNTAGTPVATAGGSD